MKQSMVPGLQTLRVARGLTRADIAELLEVHYMSVYFWETGVHAPRLKMLMRIAHAFGVSPNDLLEWDEHAMDTWDTQRQRRRYVNETRAYLN